MSQTPVHRPQDPAAPAVLAAESGVAGPEPGSQIGLVWPWPQSWSRMAAPAPAGESPSSQMQVRMRLLSGRWSKGTLLGFLQ